MSSLALASTVAGSSVVLEPKAGEKPIALVFIHGMSCKPESYKALAEEFQAEAAAAGYKAYVGIPEFIFDAPEPILIDHYVESTIADLEKKGFTGDNIFMAAHSLGGVMSQDYVKKNPKIKGNILMGSALLRKQRKIEDDGHSKFTDLKTPTLSLFGLKDGLLRISRGAESYWHQEKNIDSSQKGMFPVVAIDGASHSSFMDRTMDLPSHVKDNDLNPEIAQEDGYKKISESMIAFMSNIIGDKTYEETTKALEQETDTLLKPLLTAMNLEASYDMKPACYDSKLINPDSKKCMHGSDWTKEAQKIMGGDLGKNVDITTNDNFHQVYTVTPVHLPEIDTKCDGKSKCTLKTISVTENYYARLDIFDTGETEIGAVEMKAKLMSRQSVQVAGGNADADFHKTDEEGNRCADINQASLDWALKNASPDAVKRYNKVGKKLVIGEDEGPYNAGPLWIWKYLAYEDNADKTQTVIKSPMMRTPVDYPISAAAGFHYCKLLSPFRAMEWIYIDSLYDHNGIKSNMDESELEMPKEELFLF